MGAGSFVIVLTFMVSGYSGAWGPEQKSVMCPDALCVQELKEDAMRSPACIRFRAWEAADFHPILILRAFELPPYLDWQKG